MDNIRFQSFYRRWDDNELVGVDQDGQTYPYEDWTVNESLACVAAGRTAGFKALKDLPTDRLISLGDADDQDNDPMKDGGEGGEPGDDESDGGDDGSGDPGDQDGEGQAGDDESDGEEGDDESDAEPNFQSGDGEDDPFDDPICDDIWPIIRPRVVQIAETRASQAYVQANRYSRMHGGGGGSGKLTVRISGRKTGEVSNVQHYQFDKLLRAVGRGMHVYLSGPPGTGKSAAAYNAAQALGVPFSVSSFSPMSTESKLIGFRDAHGGVVRTEYRERYETGGVWCGDELDNSNPAIVAGLNSGLANGFMEFPDGTIERHQDFVCIATANTLGTGPTAQFAGRQKLDPATLNRFVKIHFGTDEALESTLVEAILSERDAERWLSKVRHLRRAVDDLGIMHFVTMRDSINGATLCAPGDGKFTMDEALELTILGVLSEDQRAKVKNWR